MTTRVHPLVQLMARIIVDRNEAPTRGDSVGSTAAVNGRGGDQVLGRSAAWGSDVPAGPAPAHVMLEI